MKQDRITKNLSLLNNLNLNYSFEFTPRIVQVVTFFTMLIIYHINIVMTYKKNELQSTFVETVNQKKSNIIVGVIYKHPSMDLTDFNFSYF